MSLSHSYTVMPAYGQVYGITASTTGVVFAVPKDWLGKTVMFTAEACQVYGIFTTGTAADLDTVTRGSTGAVATNVFTPAPTVPLLVPTGSAVSVLVPKNATFMKVLNDNGTGFWCAYLSDAGRFA
jgi:hypothetical protein